MLLSCRFLIDVANVNNFEQVASVELYSGDTQTVYFQLIDASLDRAEQMFNPAGRRYCPPATSTLQVTLVNVDDALKIVRTATQPYAQDPSIWSVPFLASDPLKGTAALNLVLTEPSRTLNARFAPGSVLRIKG